MKHFLVAAIVLGVSSVAFAQDPVKVAPKNYRVIAENAGVRVLRISVAPGEKGPMHSHPDCVLIPLTTASGRFTMADGKVQDSNLVAETAQYLPAHGHSGENTGKTAVDAILVEFKTAAPGKAVIPTTREGIATMKPLAEGPRAIAMRSTAAPTFAEPPGSTHDYDQVVIALGAAQMSLALDGKPAKTTWARGDTVFIPRGTAHESKNASGKPLDFIIVAIK